ncbi:MAG: helix-turn-helix domain-containing protein [Candidatus Binatus sp.]
MNEAFNIWLERIAMIRIRRTLLFCNGNRARAARMLGMRRETLWRYLSRADARELAAIPSEWPKPFPLKSQEAAESR